MRCDQVIVAVVLASVLLLTAGSPVSPATGVSGPCEEDLIIGFYANLTEAYRGLKTGDVDMVLGRFTKSLTTLASEDANLVLAPVADLDLHEFDLNCNWSISSYPGVRSPMNYVQMRQAIAWLTDKNYIVDVICEGFAERIDQMVPAPMKGWANISMWYPHYPYEYNPLAAKAVLDSTFPEGTTPNPHYDPEFPGSAQHLRTYPADHSLAGQTLHPLVVCIRSDDYERYQAGTLVADLMERMGLPLARISGPKPILYDRVMGDFNYHFYTGAWSVGRFPPLSLYGLYHSGHTYPYGSNYVTGNGTFPHLDELLEDGNYATTYNDAVTACKLACGYMTELCVTIPLYSTRSFHCYSRQLLGVVNMEGYGPDNGYTFMNAYKTEGGPIRLATLSGAPYSLNVLYSSWVQDWQCLDQMNVFSGVSNPPYNLAVDMPGFTRDWETTTWDDSGDTKTKLTMTFRSDGSFVKPVSGGQGRNVNATHYFMSAWYLCQTTAWWSDDFWDLHHIDLTGAHSCEVYFDTLSYFNTYYCQGPVLPMDTWAQFEELVAVKTETFVNQTTPSVIEIHNPIWIDEVTFNGSPLIRFADYNIVNTYHGGWGGSGALSINRSLGAGTVEVTYRSIGETLGCGYTPAYLPWQTILEGAGMYYAVDFVPGDGGYLALERNPFYYMGTPLLGDIDFTRKPTGAMKVDIFDLALAGAAFGSQGLEFPSKNWFPGADLAPPIGSIDIYDEVTVTGANWDQEYDFPE